MYTDLSSDISSKASELRPGRRGGVALALPHFFGKVIHFLLIIKICDKSSLHFASDASVHYNSELTPEWFDKNTLTRDFKLTLFFVLRYLLVHVPVYENISHVYLLHCSIYIHVSTSVHNLYLDLKYIDIA